MVTSLEMDSDLEECLGAELEQFVADWRRELVTPTRGVGEGRLLGKRVEQGFEEDEDDGGSVSEGEEGYKEQPAAKKPAPREPSPLLVLPAGRQTQNEDKEGLPSPKMEGGTDWQPSTSSLLVDTLIADLVGP